MFFDGLEGLLGAPSAKVLPTMALEHASSMQFEAWNFDVKRRTTPLAEFVFVVGDLNQMGVSLARPASSSSMRREPSAALSNEVSVEMQANEYASSDYNAHHDSIIHIQRVWRGCATRVQMRRFIEYEHAGARQPHVRPLPFTSRVGGSLAAYAALEPVRRAGLMLAEVAGVRLYT